MMCVGVCLKGELSEIVCVCIVIVCYGGVV